MGLLLWVRVCKFVLIIFLARSTNSFTRKPNFPNHKSQPNFPDKFVLFKVFGSWGFEFYQIKKPGSPGFTFYLTQVDETVTFKCFGLYYFFISLYFAACVRLTQYIKNAMSVLLPVSNRNFSFADMLFSRTEKILLALSISSRHKVLLLLSLVLQVCSYMRACTHTHMPVVVSSLSLTKGELLSTFFFLLSWLYLSGKDHHALI